MQSISNVLKGFELKKEKIAFKSFRDELISKMTDDINLLRKETKYTPITKKLVALRLNRNPFYAKSDTEVQWLYEYCNKSRCYAKFFYDCSLKKIMPKTFCYRCKDELERANPRKKAICFICKRIVKKLAAYRRKKRLTKGK